MKKFLATATAAVFLATAGSAMAAINLSRHDMGADAMNISGLVGSYGDCSACHLPHKAQGAKLWLVPPPSAYHADFALVGTLCARCHAGSGIAGSSADMRYSIYNDPAAGILGHGMLATAMPDSPSGNPGSAELSASGLPYTGGTNPPVTTDHIECTSCHDVHNSNSNRPFLQTASLDVFCVTCHTGRENGTTGATNPGLHPTNIAFGDNTENPSPVVTTAMAAISAGTGLAADADAWNSGGHAIGGTTLDCVSCHAVHGDEPDTYGEDNEAGQGYYESSLLFTSAVIESSVAGVYHNLFCESCHQGDSANEVGGDATTFPNPGDTPAGAGNDVARTWHPVDAGEENGTGRIVAIASPEPTGFQFGGGAGGDVVCTSCHSAHGNVNGGGLAGTANLANAPILRTDGASSFCMACHDATNAVFDCFHAGHFNGGGGSTSTGMTTPGTAWNPVGTGLDCGMCHGAHNTSYVPILKSPGPSSTTTPDQVCVDCHTQNPSTFTTAGGAGLTGTHFLGNPTQAGAVGADWLGGAAGYGVANFTIVPEKLDNDDWSTTGAFSIYANAAGNKGGMTCVSCHTTGDSCGDAGVGVVDQTGDADATYMMLTGSGNNKNISGLPLTQGTPDTYLCTGCHGYPDALTQITGSETGSTHPTGAVATGVHTPVAASSATKTGDGTMNCESCHRAHDADDDGGTYILEGGNGDQVYNGTGPTALRPSHTHDTFCSGCHSTY